MNQANETITTGKVVSLHYTLTNAAGDVLDQSEEGDPLHYLHGFGNIVPGLENALGGHAVGDRLQVNVPPAEGYGDRTGPGPQAVARENFPDDVDIVPGMQFLTEAPNGQAIPVWVVDVQAEHVFLDINHPLAGETLHFDVTVAAVRDATPEEMNHGHPHGATGHEGHDHDHDEAWDEEEE